MKHTAVVLVLGSFLALAGDVRADLVNVAQGENVSVVAGTVYGTLSTVTDGLFLPESQQWQTDTAYWYYNATLEIDLGAAHTIVGAAFQCDDNDSYRLDYWDADDQSWETLWAVPNYDAGHWGMTTRPYPGGWQELGAVVTSKVRFTQTSGDNCYSVSEIQLMGGDAVVPLPASVWSGLALGGLALAGRRTLRK